MSFIVAAWFLVQALGLVFIEGIAERISETDDRTLIPLSVRAMGYVADELHRTAGIERLSPDGSNWPLGFRIFFTIEMCGLGVLSLGFFQLGASLACQRDDWNKQAHMVLRIALPTMVLAVLLLARLE